MSPFCLHLISFLLLLLLLKLVYMWNIISLIVAKRAYSVYNLHITIICVTHNSYIIHMRNIVFGYYCCCVVKYSQSEAAEIIAHHWLCPVYSFFWFACEIVVVFQVDLLLFSYNSFRFDLVFCCCWFVPLICWNVKYNVTWIKVIWVILWETLAIRLLVQEINSNYSKKTLKYFRH